MVLLFRSWCALALLLLFVSSAAAVGDLFIKIEPSKEESQLVKLDFNYGSCKVLTPPLKVGKYTITLCDSTGTPLTPRKKPQRLKTDTSTNYARVYFSYMLKETPDPSTGKAKRSHAINKINKELAPGDTFITTATVIADGKLDIASSMSWSDGRMWEYGDWLSSIPK